ncbi:MAG: A24 family peptidase [Candidatus Methanomethyliaceae archaeon]
MGVYWEAAKMSFIIILAVVAAITDLGERRIPNGLVYPAMLVGIILHLITGQAGKGFLGLSLGFIVLVLPWTKGWLGEGDVKLAMAIGALGGPQFLLKTLVLGSVAGSIAGIILLVRAGKLKRFGHNVCAGIVALLSGSKVDLEGLDLYMPYGPFISIGVLMSLGWRGDLNALLPH